MQLNHRESATVLAALRFWQRNVIGCQHPYLLTTRIPDELRGHFDESSPLAENEVDTVCERLNSDRCEDEVTEIRTWLMIRRRRGWRKTGGIPSSS